MNKRLAAALSITGLLLLGASTQSFAADKVVTIKGEGQCAKCSLKETEACQNAIKVEEKGKKVTYYLVQNDVSKKFHKNICTTKEQVTAEGTVKEVNGKKEFTATKIDLVKK
ncbi:MAG: hypothetical protein HY674_07000 [Chloroflexi bacterium]|nr:hypothetical protein [Chloroflexota bacterium]